MIRKLLATYGLAVVATSAYAQPVTFTLEDEAAGAGAGYVAGDIMMALTSSADFLATMVLSGTAHNGATFVYGHDANDIAVGSAPDREGNGGDRWTTFLSMPRGKSDSGRFTNFGEASMLGTPVLGSTSLDIEAFDDLFPSETGPGYVARITLDISGTGFSSNSIYFAATNSNPGDLTLAEGTFGIGTAQFPQNWTDYPTTWGIYKVVPEPALVVLLVFGSLAALRRR